METSFRILLVDDNADIIQMLKESLCENMSQKMTFFDASDGHQALTIVKNNKVDLIISDEVMPHLSGSGFVKSARALGIDCPAFILSGLESPRVKHMIKDLEKVEVLAKPIDLEHLSSAVKNVIELHFPLVS